jgi:hypothetical protein
MTGYFQQVPTSHSELEELFVTGRYVTTRERAEWRNAQGPQVQRAVAVYELDGGRILRVWYFPAQR